MRSLSLTETRNQLLQLADQLEREPGLVVEVTKRGRRVMTLLAAKHYEALLETLEVLGDAAAMGSLRRARKEIAAGKGIPWRKARAGLGLGS